MKRPQQEIPGSFVKIRLGDTFHSYARILDNGNFAFYNLMTDKEVDIEDILKLDIAFIAIVDKFAITKGRWLIVGRLPLEERLRGPHLKYVVDAFDQEKYFIYKDGTMLPATKNDCKGLEVFASWNPEQIEDRLVDHFNGRKNMWLESIDKANQ